MWTISVTKSTSWSSPGSKWRVIFRSKEKYLQMSNNLSLFRSKIAELRWGGQLRAIVSSGKNSGWPKNIPKNCEKKQWPKSEVVGCGRDWVPGWGGDIQEGGGLLYALPGPASFAHHAVTQTGSFLLPFLITSPVKNTLHPLPSSHTKRAKRFLWKRRYNCFCSYSRMQDGRKNMQRTLPSSPLPCVSQLFSKRSQRNDENGHFLSTEIGIVSHCFLFNWRSS